MKLAAIDIGSNSVHMIVAEIDGDGNFEIIAREKEMVRLGERSLADGFLNEAAQQRGLTALAAFKRTADAFGVADIIAYATSATREARNGQDFIDRVFDEVGIRARIIEGTEEGRLIYLGAREVFDFGSRKAMIIDIGGGSVEFILADQRREYLVYSLKLGVRRLHEGFLPSDPPSEEELEALRSHIRSTVEYVVRKTRRRGFDVVLGSSGTAKVLARITSGHTGNTTTFTTREDLATTVARLAVISSVERGSVPGVDDKRRDAILEGSVLMLTLLETFGANGFDYCDAALREGMIIDYLERNRPGLRMMQAVTDPRRRSVVLFAKRMYTSMAHVEHVAAIAVRIFDDLTRLHQLSAANRELLEFAALLHDVGRAVSSSAHHKHTLYIVENADIVGFSDREKSLIANVGRYHRRSIPRPRHAEWMALEEADRDLVVTLSTILRLANALDRGHHGNVVGVRTRFDEEAVTIEIETHGSADVELRAIERKAHHVERVFGRDLRVATASSLDPIWSEET